MVTPHTFLLSLTLALGLGDAAAASPYAPELLRTDLGPVVTVDGWLGVMLDTQAEQATISEVIPGSPAAKAGVKAGDVVLAVDDQKIANATGLIAAIRGRDVGSTVRLRVRRGEETKNLSVTLGERPADSALQSTAPRRVVQGGRPSGPVTETTVPQGAPYVGVRLDESNLEILEVVAGGPADKAGIKKGDVVQAAGGRPLTTLAALDQMMKRARPGMTVTVRLKRGDGSVEKRLTFGAKPTAKAAKTADQSGGQKSRPAGVKAPKKAAKAAKPAKPAGKPFAGVRLDESNLTILDVYPGGPAAKAGLKKGDVVQAAGGRRLGSLEALDQMMQRAKPGMTVTVRVRRGDQTIDKRLTFGSMPSDLGGGVAKTDKKKVVKAKQAKKVVKAKQAKKVVKAKQAKKTVKAKAVAKAKAPQGAANAKPWVGVRIDEESMELLAVTEGGPAAAAGLKKGDVLQAAGGRRIGNIEALDAMLKRARPGMIVTVRVRRGDQTLDRKLTIGTRGQKRPAPSVAASRPAALRGRNPGRRVRAAAPARAVAKAKSARAKIGTGTPAKLAFATDWASGQAKAKKAGKPMFVMFGASWCSTCKAQKKAFANSGVISALGNYVPVYIDTDKQGKLADRHGVVELPHMVVVTAAGKTVQKHAGFLPSDRLSAFLKRGAVGAKGTKALAKAKRGARVTGRTRVRTGGAVAKSKVAKSKQGVAAARKAAAEQRAAAAKQRKVAAAKRTAKRKAAAAKRAAARTAAAAAAKSRRPASGARVARRPVSRVASGRPARRVATGNSTQMREIAGLRREVAQLRKEIAALRSMVRDLNAPRRRR